MSISCGLILFCGFGEHRTDGQLDDRWLKEIVESNFTMAGDVRPEMRRVDKEPGYDPIKGCFDEKNVFAALSRWIEERGPDDRFYVLVVVLAEQHQVAALDAALAPWVGLKRFSPRHFPMLENQRRRVRNGLQKEVRNALRLYQRSASVLSQHFHEAKRRTPLLLPDRKTGHRIIPLLNDLHAFVGTDLRAEIERMIAAFDRQHGVGKSPKAPKKKQSFYQIEGLTFECPAGVGHAWQRSATCTEACFLRARLRLGVSIDPRFHYDCRATTGALPKVFLSCHEQEARPSRATKKGYVNIAPNDFVR